MARGCSDSDSEEERHDRFKSERNPSSATSFRKIPGSLETYLPRARSPLRPTGFRNSRHRSRYSEERRRSPHRRDKKSYKETDKKRSSSSEYKDRHRRKRSHDRSHEGRHESVSRKKSKEKDEKYLDHDRKSSRERDHKHRKHRDRKGNSRERDKKLSCVKRRKSRDDLLIDHKSGKTTCQLSSDKSIDSDSSLHVKSDNDENKVVISDTEVEMLPRYYELAEDSLKSDPKSNSDEKHSKKHKKSRDRSQSHNESRKRKKDKKHKRKHEKRKSESDASDSKVKSENKIEDSSRLSDNGASSHELRNNSSQDSDSDVQIGDVKDKSDNFENIDLNNDNDEGSNSSSNNIVENESSNNIVENESSNNIVDSDRLNDNGSNEKRAEHEEGEISGSESEQYFGPALPPEKKAEPKMYGPQMPTDEELYGPVLPPSAPAALEEDAVEEDGEVIGPHPAGHESMTQAALDARASFLINHLDNKTDSESGTRREAWMTELPEARRAQLGLGPRKFRANAGPDMSDRSSWTDTPRDKAKKLLDPSNEDAKDLDTKKLEIMEKNKEMELLAKKSEKKSKSLLEMHQKDIKKKKKKDKDKKPERRPFSREVDLQTNKFDEAQKKSIIKKAQLLNTRFSAGESKFL